MNTEIKSAEEIYIRLDAECVKLHYHLRGEYKIQMDKIRDMLKEYAALFTHEIVGDGVDEAAMNNCDKHWGHWPILDKERGSCIKSFIAGAQWQAQQPIKSVPDDIYLEKINSLMWETWGIKSKDFGRKEGEVIMDILNEWAANEQLKEK